MAALQKSKDKRKALVKATINLVNNNGFHATPMSKIAKMAKVSPATIYIYFENKQDLINQVYLEVKQAFTKHAFKDNDIKMPVEKAFEIVWKSMADFKLKEIEKAMFLAQCDNTLMIEEEIRLEGLKHLQPIIDLWQRGQEDGVIKKMSPFLLYAYTIYPMAFLMSMQQRNLFELNETHIEDSFQSAWNSIKI